MSPPSEPDFLSDDLYRVLGVTSGATEKEVSGAYKRLALRLHPDKNPTKTVEAEDKFKKVTQAYETLRDQSKRREYDFQRKPARPRIPEAWGTHASAWAPHVSPSSSSSTPPWRTGPASYEGSKGSRAGASFGSYDRAGAGVGSYERADELYRAYFGRSFGDCGRGSHGLDFVSAFDFGLPKRPSYTDSSTQRVELAHVVPVGTAVVVHGLLETPEHNGKSARISSWDQLKGRYDVRLDCARTLSVRPRNVTQCCHVEIVDPEKRSDLTRKYGDIFNYDDTKGHYTVMLKRPASVVELSPANCIFAMGTRVKLHGLSDEQLNGQMAQIMSVDYEASRYVVQCQCGRQVKIKFEKALC